MNFYTLVLSTGSHIVEEATADQIIEALKRGEKVMRVDADLLGCGNLRRNIQIALAHVVELIPNDSEIELREEELPDNVFALRFGGR